METANSWDEVIRLALDLLDKSEVQAVATINLAEYRQNRWFAIFELEFRQAVTMGVIPQMYPAISFRTFTKELNVQGKTIKEFVILYLKEGEII